MKKYVIPEQRVKHDNSACSYSTDNDQDESGDSTDEDIGKSPTEIYLEEGLIVDDEGTSLCQIKEDEKPILVDILTAITAAKDGYNLLANSARLLEKAVLMAPDLKSLANILSSATSFNPNAVSAATSRGKYKRQSVKFGVPKEYNPKKKRDGRYKCRLCKFQGGSWSGVDSHIRRDHSKIYYGPCGDGCTFTSPNIDSWRRHCRACKHMNT